METPATEISVNACSEGTTPNKRRKFDGTQNTDAVAAAENLIEPGVDNTHIDACKLVRIDISLFKKWPWLCPYCAKLNLRSKEIFSLCKKHYVVCIQCTGDIVFRSVRVCIPNLELEFQCPMCRDTTDFPPGDLKEKKRMDILKAGIGIFQGQMVILEDERKNNIDGLCHHKHQLVLGFGNMRKISSGFMRFFKDKMHFNDTLENRTLEVSTKIRLVKKYQNKWNLTDMGVKEHSTRLKKARQLHCGWRLFMGDLVKQLEVAISNHSNARQFSSEPFFRWFQEMAYNVGAHDERYNNLDEDSTEDVIEVDRSD